MKRHLGKVADALLTVGRVEPAAFIGRSSARTHSRA
jgi:hypothetical protein